MRIIQFLTVFIFLLILNTSPTRADGLVSAVSFMSIPSGSAITVRTLNNSDSNMILKKDFELALKDKGYKIGQNESLVLTFETTDVSGAWIGGGENLIIELSNHDIQSGTDMPRVHLNLFNSRRGGIFNSNRIEKTRTVTPSSFRIDVIVDDKSNGKRIWQGWSSIISNIGSNQKPSRKMVSALVKSLGQNINRKSFSLAQ